MGSGSSSSKKTVPSANVEQGEDIKAIKLIKQETQALEDVRVDRRRLDDFIVRFNKQKNKTEFKQDNEKLITDRVEELVDDLVDYVDKINTNFDELKGSLQLFHDAVVKMSEEAKSVIQTKSTRRDVSEIIKELEKRVKIAKEQTASIKSKNTTPETLDHTEEEIKRYIEVKLFLEKENERRCAKKKEFVDQMKSCGLSYPTIESIVEWKADAERVENEFGYIISGKESASEESKTKLKELEDRNEELNNKLITLQRQCDESDILVEKAHDSVQKVEEKILEERLSHEVEINALKALIEKKNRYIKQLGGSEVESPVPDDSKEECVQKPVNERDTKCLNETKETDAERDNQVVFQNGGIMINDEQPSNNIISASEIKKENSTSIQSEPDQNLETKLGNGDTNAKAVNYNEEKDKRSTDEKKDSKYNGLNEGQDSERTSRDVKIALISLPDDKSAQDKSRSDTERLKSNSLVSTGIQVSNDDFIEIENMKISEKEQTSSDLGQSVKSEFIGNNHNSYDADDDTCNETLTTNDYKSPVEREEPDMDIQNETIVLNLNQETKIASVYSPNLSQTTDKYGSGDNMESNDNIFIENFADMINLVNKDECITALETTEDDVHLYEGTTKEIVYKRHDGSIDWNVAYHQGIGAVVRTTHPDFGIDTIRVDIIDEVESSMLPDLVLGERPISFHLHIRQKDGVSLDLQETEVKVFVPHRPLQEYEDVILIYSLNGEDWEDCDLVDELPASVDNDLDIVGTVLPCIQDVKLVVIARERMIDLMAGEGDISYVSSFDESIRVNISKDTFRSHTIAKLLVHHSHIMGLKSAVSMHEECRNIESCTPFISIVCATVTMDNILVDMNIAETGIDEDNDCRYIMFCLTESGWRLADCTWDISHRRLTINLMPGSRFYRIIGIDVPNSMHMEERLGAVKTLHEHINHYQVCVFVRQRLDDPQQAVVMCLRAHLVDLALLELVSKGFSLGNLISEVFCIMDGDVLSIEVTGNIAAKPINSDKMTMTFYPQREMSTKLLQLLPVESDDNAGIVSIIKHDLDENFEVLGGKIGLTVNA